MKFYVAPEWDLDLPPESTKDDYEAARIAAGLPAFCTIEAEEEDDIADALSDTYHWLVSGYAAPTPEMICEYIGIVRLANRIADKIMEDPDSYDIHGMIVDLLAREPATQLLEAWSEIITPADGSPNLDAWIRTPTTSTSTSTTDTLNLMKITETCTK